MTDANPNAHGGGEPRSTSSNPPGAFAAEEGPTRTWALLPPGPGERPAPKRRRDARPPPPLATGWQKRNEPDSSPLKAAVAEAAMSPETALASGRMSVTEKAAPLVDADELSCTMCRASNAAGARFCNSCGSTLEPTPLVLSSVPAAKAAEASPASTKAFARQPSRPEEEIRCGECSTLNPPHLHLCQWCDMPLGSPGGAPASIEPPVQMERAPASLEPVETDLRPRFETPAAIVTDLGPDTQVDPLEQMPDVVPLRRGRWVPALWGIAAVAAIACGLLLRSSAPMQKAAASPLVAATSTPIALAVPAPAAAEPAAPPVAVKAPPVAAAPPAKAAKPEVPSGMGLLNTAGLSAGHRIFVNGKVVGQTPRAALVRCGAVKVRIGSAGRTHVVDVPCGNEAFVTP